MKQVFIGVLLLCLATSTLAQETLLSGDIDHGGYGGPFVKVGPINGGTGVFVGGQGGWIINHTFVLGGKGYGLSNRIEISGADNKRLDFTCGGVLLQYIHNSDKLLHFTVESMIGSGNVRYTDADLDTPLDDESPSDHFFVLEPGVSAVLNVSKNMRIAAGASYRYINGVKYADLADSDLSGLSLQVVLKFGGF